MKRFASLALLICLFFNFLHIAHAEADIPSPKGDIYVQDFAKVMSDEDKEHIIELGKKLEDSTKAQIAILTIDSLEDNSLEEYSNEAFRKYKLGDKELNNGVLIFLAMKEKRIRIEVGYGLEGAVTDIKSGEIRDKQAIPYLKEGKTSKAIMETYKAVYNEVAKEYDLGNDFQQKVSKPHPQSNKSDDSLSPIAIIIIVIIVIILVILDFKYFDGTITYLIINILSSFRGSDSGSNSRGGGGGSSGGGGASGRW